MDSLKFAKVNASVNATAAQFGVTVSTVFQAAYILTKIKSLFIVYIYTEKVELMTFFYLFKILRFKL